MWYDNPNLVYLIMKIAIRKPNVFSRLMSMSSYHYSIGVGIMNNTKGELKCKCNCKKNKEYKIIDETRKLHCHGCVDTIASNCWSQSDYISNAVIKSNVCRKCYKDHWYQVMRRRMTLCIVTEEDE
jgi:hypothetical protein